MMYPTYVIRNGNVLHSQVVGFTVVVFIFGLGWDRCGRLVAFWLVSKFKRHATLCLGHLELSYVSGQHAVQVLIATPPLVPWPPMCGSTSTPQWPSLLWSWALSEPWPSTLCVSMHPEFSTTECSGPFCGPPFSSLTLTPLVITCSCKYLTAYTNVCHACIRNYCGFWRTWRRLGSAVCQTPPENKQSTQMCSCVEHAYYCLRTLYCSSSPYRPCILYLHCVRDACYVQVGFWIASQRMLAFWMIFFHTYTLNSFWYVQIYVVGALHGYNLFIIWLVCL